MGGTRTTWKIRAGAMADITDPPPYTRAVALAVGASLGPYEILALIGTGGMCEVYRARDGALQRDVAVKVLPELFAQDPDRLARFKREAQLLASLNHPNIAAIYGFEESTGVRALVLELVEGPTLADRIAEGAIPPDEALPIARQIAEALQAAHEHGVIHRDLKPANIKLRPDGAVKVLDLGLAKLNEPNASSVSTASNRSQSPTITSPAMMTGAGTILGTAAYMAPEQARGQAVDGRADIWAFGCVVYEMLTGRRPFEGEHVADTLANVLKTPPDWSALPAQLPGPIRVLLQRCLEKQRERRVASAATLVYVISDAASLASPGVSAGQDAPPRRGSSFRPGPYVAAAVLAMMVGAAAWSFRPSPPPPSPVRFDISNLVMPLASAGRNRIAVSADGTHLVYNVLQGWFLRNLSEQDPQRLPGSGGQAAFSPDGRRIAVYENGTIKRLDIASGSTTPVCAAEAVSGMTWHTSGILIGQGAKGIIRCPVDGGPPEQLVTVGEDELADGPQILPDGDSLLFSVAKSSDGPARWDDARVIVRSLRTRTERVVVEGGSAARFVASGHLLYARGGVVYGVPFDPARLTTTGEAVAVVEGVSRVASGLTGGAQFTVSDNGHLFYIPGAAGAATAARRIAVADRAGAVTPLDVPPGSYVHTRVSHDARRLAIGSDDGREATISIYGVGGSVPPQRLILKGRNEFPIWSGAGDSVAFQSDQEGDRAIWMHRADGTGSPQRLTTAPPGVSHVPESWSRDGRYLLYSVVQGVTHSLWTLSIADRTATPLGVTGLQSMNAVFSPNGRWIAYSPGADSGVAVKGFPAGSTFRAPKVGLDFHPVWVGDTTLVYVVSAATRQLATVTVTDKGGSLVFGAPSISPARVTARRISSQRRAHDILPDGRFVGLVDEAEPAGPQAITSPVIRVVLNWHEELKRLVPTR